MDTTKIANPLVLALPLDEIPVTQTVNDLSINSNQKIEQRDINVVPDDQFGSCIDFKGTAEQIIKVTNCSSFPTSTLTVCFWVKSNDQDAANNPTLFSYVTNGESTVILRNTGNLEAQINEYALQISEGRGQVSLNDGKWHHLTITWENSSGTLVLYVDGEERTKETLNHTEPLMGDGYIILGQDKSAINEEDDHSETNQAFKGQMAHVHVYDEVLGQDKIRTLMQRNKTAQATFKTVYPVDFTLLDGDMRNVLYISDNANSANFQVVLENTSDKHIHISGIGENPSEIHYHVAFRFKAKTFEQNIMGTDKSYIRGLFSSDSKWEVSNAVFNETDDKISIYLLHRGTASFLWKAGKKIDFSFEYGSADGTKGTRGTTVELLYDNLSYVHDSAILRGTRIQNVDIINQRGKKNIPLHAGIVGSNTILNNASANSPASGASSTLKIRVVNTLKDGVLPFRIGEVDSERNTKFTLLFDNPVGKEWDLASANQLNAIVVSGTNCQAKKNNQSSIPAFEITPTVTQLKAEEGIEISLSNIHSNSPSGLANIYLQYEDIPGYWDGRFVLQVEKTPIVHRDVGGERNVGIGTDNPKIHLAIGNNDTGFKQEGDGKLAIYSKNIERIRIHNNGNVGFGTTDPKEKLHVKGGNIRIDSGEIQSWGSLKFRPDIDDSGDGIIQFLNAKGDENVRIHSNGNVGIGTDNPLGRLNISGSNGVAQGIQLDNREIKFRFDGKQHFSIYNNKTLNHFTIENTSALKAMGVDGKVLLAIHKDGNVGFGTTNPKEKLHVKGGNIRIDSGEIQSWGSLKFRPDIDDSGDGIIQFLNAKGDENIRIHSNGYVGIGTTKADSQLSLGNWNSGAAGPSGNNAVQLLLSGKHNSGVNNGSSGGTYKLKIEGYNNDEGTVYPIYCLDENKNVDFFIKNRPKASGSPTMHFGGNVGIRTTNPEIHLAIGDDDTGFKQERDGVLGIYANGKQQVRIDSWGDLHVAGSLFTKHVPVWDGSSDYDLTWNNNSKRISREGSSLRFKKNIKPLKDDFRKILEIQAKQYQMRKEFGDSGVTKLGYIAEEMADAGLEFLIMRDDEGNPDGIKYKMVVLYVNEVVKEHDVIINEQDQKIKEQENEMISCKNQLKEQQKALKEQDKIVKSLVKRLEKLEGK